MKNFVRSSWSLLALLLIAGCIFQIRAQGDGEQGGPFQQVDTHYRAFRNNLRSLLNQANYKELDAIATTVESQKLRFKGGWWQIHEYYAILCCTELFTATDDEWAAHFAQLEDWAKQMPESVVPRILLAEGYEGFAWKARGHGETDTVTPQGWKLFGERMQKARAILESLAPAGRQHAEWYDAMQGIALTQGWPASKEYDLTTAALKLEPGYYPVARQEANFLLPKWYGKPGDTERVAAELADSVGGDDGNIQYYMVAVTTNCCRRMQAPALDWSRVQQGYEAIKRNYGAITRQTNIMAFFALRYGDHEAASKYFEEIGDNWDQVVWRSKARFDASRTGTALGGVNPVTAFDAGKSDAEPNQ